MWDSFACPSCHKWLRVRRNYGARLARIAAILAVLMGAVIWIRGRLPDTLPIKHIDLRIDAAAIGAAVAAVDEGILWLLPKHIEPAGQSGLAI